MSDPTITDKAVTATVVEPTTPGPLPGVAATTQVRLDAIEVDLRGGYVRSGEHIAEDPDEFRDEWFVNAADLPSIIHAWALAAVRHLADQPATTGGGRAEALSNLLRRSARKTADCRRYADTLVQGGKERDAATRRILDERQQEIDQLRARLLHLSEEHAACQSADRDTETAALLRADAANLREAADTWRQAYDQARADLAVQRAEHAAETTALRAELANVREMLIAEHVHTPRHCGHDVGPMEVEGASECSHCGTNYGATECCPGRCDVVRVEHDHETTAAARPPVPYAELDRLARRERFLLEVIRLAGADSLRRTLEKHGDTDPALPTDPASQGGGE